MNKRTFLLILLLLLSVGLIIVAARTSLPKQENTPPVSKLNPTPATKNFTTLIASPSAGLLAVGEEGTFTVVIDTGANSIAAVQLEMVFNPDYISVSNITPLEFFKNQTILLNEVDNKNGSISYALGTTESRSGRGELVTITVVGKKTTGNNSTPMTFLPKTSVGEVGNPASVLKNTIGVNFLIK